MSRRYYHAGVVTNSGQIEWVDELFTRLRDAQRAARRLKRQLRGGYACVESWAQACGDSCGATRLEWVDDDAPCEVQCELGFVR